MQERIDRYDQLIGKLIFGQRGGPFDQTLDSEQASVLRAIRYHRGAKHAIPIHQLRALLKMSDRKIKDIVRNLRISFHLPIGSSKSGTEGGYFLILTPEDQKVFDRTVLDQVYAQIQAHRGASGPARTGELLGQLLLEVQK